MSSRARGIGRSLGTEIYSVIGPPRAALYGPPPPRSWQDFRRVDGREGPRFGAMIGLVAIVVATVILVFFGIGYALGRLFL
jgi:hypothetical protein